MHDRKETPTGVAGQVQQRLKVPANARVLEVRLMSICGCIISSHPLGATACTQAATEPGKPCKECSEQEAARKMGETEHATDLLDRAKRLLSLDKWREALRRGWVRKG
jgi:hypothetical protein